MNYIMEGTLWYSSYTDVSGCFSSELLQMIARPHLISRFSWWQKTGNQPSHMLILNMCSGSWKTDHPVWITIGCAWTCENGGFHGHGGYPQMHGKLWNIPLEWMIWGYPYFRKPSFSYDERGTCSDKQIQTRLATTKRRAVTWTPTTPEILTSTAAWRRVLTGQPHKFAPSNDLKVERFD